MTCLNLLIACKVLVFQMMLISLATVTLAESVMTTISASPVEQAMQVMEVWPSVESSGDIFPSQNRNNNTATVCKPEQSVRYRAGPQYSSLPWSYFNWSLYLELDECELGVETRENNTISLSQQRCWSWSELSVLLSSRTIISTRLKFRFHLSK